MRLSGHALQQGSTLFEVMICLFMLILPIFGMTALKLTQAHIVLQQSQYKSAWALMEYKQNELRYLTDSIDEFNALSSNSGGGLVAGNIDYDQYQFNLTWQVTETTTKATSSLLKEVIVKISWVERNDISRTISDMTTLNRNVIVR